MTTEPAITVWTGKGSPTLADRRKRLPEFQSRNRRATGAREAPPAHLSSQTSCMRP